MGAQEDAMITVRLDLKHRYTAIMVETQMDSSELMEHFFSLYNSNVEKVWSESYDSKQAKQQGLQKETEYWMKKVMSQPDHDKLFPKAQDSDNNADKTSTEPTAGSSGQDLVSPLVQGDKHNSMQKDIESIPALQLGNKRKRPRKIILTLPDNILSKDLAINVANKLEQKKLTENTVRPVPVKLTCTSTRTAETVCHTPEGHVMPLDLPIFVDGKLVETGDNSSDTVECTTPTEQKESSPPLEGEDIRPKPLLGHTDDDLDDAVDDSMNLNYTGPDEREAEADEGLEMSVEEIGDGYQIGLNEGENVKFVRDVALSIAKDMAITENGETVFNCNFCSYKTNVLGRLRRHITVHTGKEFKCSYCSKAYTEKCKLTEHIKVKHEKSVSYPCPKCSKVFTSKRGLEYHNITFHEERGTTLKCSFCPKIFSSRFGFTYHTKTAHGEGKVEENFKSTSDTLIPMSKWEKSTYKKASEKEFQKDDNGMYSCKLCVYKTPRMFHIRRHLGVHYGNTNKCEQCEKTFSDSYKLRLHVQVKHGNLRFECDYCHRDFGTKEGLKYHRLSAHEGNWKFLCPICGQGFYQKHHFEGHVNKHKGIRAYGCKTCGKKFFYQSDVSIHKKHCGQERKPLEKPTTFVCHVCGDQFKKKSILIEHENGKHGREGHYICECGVSFKWRNSLRQHKQRCSTAAAISDCSVTDITDLSGASDFIAMQIKPELSTAEAMDTEVTSQQSDAENTQQPSPSDEYTEENSAVADYENEDDEQSYMVKTEPHDSEAFGHGAMLIPPGVSASAMYRMPTAQVSDHQGNECDFLIYLDDDSSSSSSDDCGNDFKIPDSSESEEEVDRDSNHSSKLKDFTHRQQRSQSELNGHGKSRFRCLRCGKTFRKRTALSEHRKICHRRAVIRRSVIEMYVCGFCDGRFSNKEHFRQHSKIHERKMKKRFRRRQQQVGQFRRQDGHTISPERNKSDAVGIKCGGISQQVEEDILPPSSPADCAADVLKPDQNIPMDETLINSTHCGSQEETPGSEHIRNVHSDEHPQCTNSYNEENQESNRACQESFSEHPQCTNSYNGDYRESNQIYHNSFVEETIVESFAEETVVESCNTMDHGLESKGQGKEYPLGNEHIAVVDLSNAQAYPDGIFESGWDLSIKPNYAGQANQNRLETRTPVNNDDHKETTNKVDFQTSFTCEICGATINDHEKYIEHISLHASTRIQMYQEQQNNLIMDATPSVSTTGSSNVVVKKEVNTDQEMFPCKICGDKFMKRTYLKEHMFGMHGNFNRYSCACGEQFKWRSSMNLHKERCASVQSVLGSPYIGAEFIVHSQSSQNSSVVKSPLQGPTKPSATDKRKSPISRMPPISSSSLPPMILPGIPPHYMDVMSPTLYGMMPPHISPPKQLTQAMETRVQAGEMFLHSVPAVTVPTESQRSDQENLTQFPSISLGKSPPRSSNNVQRHQSAENGQCTRTVVSTSMVRNDGPTDYSFTLHNTREYQNSHPRPSSSNSAGGSSTGKGARESERRPLNDKRIKQEVISFDDDPDPRIEVTENIINQLMLATAEPSGSSDNSRGEPHPVQMQTDHQISNEFGTYICSICQKHFRTQVSYTDHMNKHRGIKPYICKTCGMSFHYQSTLSSHRKACGIPGSSSMYKCHICGDTFTVRSYLREHVLGKHGDSRRYSCRCGATFKWRSSLGSHQRKCQVAGKS